MKNTKQLKRIISGISWIAVISLTALSVISSMFHSVRFLELTSHFKFQYFIASLLLFLFFVIRKKRALSVWLLLLLIYNSTFILPWYIPSKQNTNTKATFKLLHSNVYMRNNDKATLLQLIEHEAPDIIVAQEVDNKWVDQLSSIESVYPFNVKIPRSDNFGMALYSKFPISKKLELTLNEFGVPTISVTLKVNDRDIEIVSMHPVPPMNRKYFNSRNNQIEFIANYCQNIKTPLVLVGDFNVSLWSQYYVRLEKMSKLRNTRQGFGILPSWPSNILPLRIPIDHCMVSSQFDVVDTRLGSDVNSDHLPLIVTLEF